MAKLAAERLDLRGAGGRALQAGARRGPARRRRARRAREAGRARQGLRDRGRGPRAARGRGGRRRDARSTCCRSSARIYADRLHDHAEGHERVAARAGAVQPGHAKALRVLRDSYLARRRLRWAHELYAQNSDWEGLVEVLSGAADKASDPELKVDSQLPLRRHLRRPARRAGARVSRLRARAVGRARTTRAPRRRSCRCTRRTRSGGGCPRSTRCSCAQTRRRGRASSRCSRSSCGSPGSSCRTARRRSPGRGKAYELAPARERRARGVRGRGARRRRSGQASSTRSTPAWPPVTLRKRRGPALARRRRRRTARTARGDGARSVRALRAKLAEVYAREMGRVDEAVETYRVARRGGRGRRARRPDARPHPARVRSPRRSALALRPARRARQHRAQARAPRRVGHARGRGVRRARAGRGSLPAHARDRAAVTAPRLRALARLLRSQGDAQGAVDVLALDRDQREGAERAAREVEMARISSIRCTSRWKRSRPASAPSPCPPNDRQRDRRRRAAAADAGDARARGRASSKPPTSRPARSRARPRCSRCSSRPPRPGTIGSRSTGASPTCTRRSCGDAERRVRRRRARRRRVPGGARAVGPPGRPRGAHRPVAGARRGHRGRRAPGGRSRPARARRARSRRARRHALRREVRRRRPRAPVPRAHAGSRSPGNERAFQRLKQILTTREQLGRARGSVRAGRRGDARPRAARRAAGRGRASRRGDHRRIAARRSPTTSASSSSTPSHEQAVRSLDALYAAEQRWDRLGAAHRATPRRPRVGDEKLDLEQRLGTLAVRVAGRRGGRAVLPRARPAGAAGGGRGAAARREDPGRARAALARGNRPRGGLHRARRGARAGPRARDPPRVRPGTPTSAATCCVASPSCATSACGTMPGALEAFARLLPLDPDDARARQRMLENRAPTRRARARRRGAHGHSRGGDRPPCREPRSSMDVARLYENQLGDVGRADAVYRAGAAARPGRRQHRAAGVPLARAHLQRLGRQPQALRDPAHPGPARGRRRRSQGAPRTPGRALRDRAR